MKIGDTVIRTGMFETNSSSAHSITLADSSGIVNKLVSNCEDPEIYKIDCSYSFDWGPNSHSSFDAKLAYLILDNFNNDLIIQAIQRHSSIKYLKIQNVDDGAIDHQSVGTSHDLLTVEDVENFLFNPYSTLNIDNDNH